jgi:hypothetical protein
MTTAFVATELLFWMEVVAFKLISLSWIEDGMMQGENSTFAEKYSSL